MGAICRMPSPGEQWLLQWPSESWEVGPLLLGDILSALAMKKVLLVSTQQVSVNTPLPNC